MSHYSPLAVAVAVVAFLLPAPTRAQVAARQGSQEEIGSFPFRSPMILELPMPDLTGLTKKDSAPVSEDLSGYTCEGVSILDLVVTPDVKPRTGFGCLPRCDDKLAQGKTALEFSGSIRVPPSHDRLVKMTFALTGSSGEIGTAVGEVAVEERRTKQFRVLLAADRAQLEQAFAAGPRPVLKLTVEVYDD